MRLIIILLLIISISCEKDKPLNKVYSDWENYYEIENYETHFTINSLALRGNEEVLFSAFIRRNNFTTNSTGIFKHGNKIISSIDSATFFSDYNSFRWKKNISEKNIFVNSELLFVYDKNENICCHWHISDLKNKRCSSKGQTDLFGNIWLTSNAWQASNDGLQMYNGNTWTSYFEGSTFSAICFDLNGDLYASTLPDFEKSGIIMKYNYNKWDTIVICSGKAKWVSCMHFDSKNNLWFGVLSRSAVAPETGDGLYKYDGKSITQYHINNSKLPSNSVIDIAIDNEDNKWIAMYSGGLAKLSHDGKWKIFNTLNTPMSNISIEHVAIDNDKNVWMTVQFMGLARLKE